METKINVAAIIKDKPQGTKLYADAFGELSIEDIYAEGKDELGITLSSKDGDELLFYNNGKYNIYGEPILVPSKSMHDWSKFAWKKGDVLVSEGRGRLHVIFEGFNDDTYTTFKGKHYICNYDDNEDYNEEEYNDYNKEVNERTVEFKKDNDDGAQTYINTIEKRLGGKLNRETLEIEKTQPEFKDGDIVYMGNAWNEYIGIIKNRTSGNQIETYAHCHKDSKEEAVLGLWLNKNDSDELRLATNSEKQQLFDALAKEGKAWDAETKTLEDLPKKCEFEPFDKVLVRNTDTEEWFPGFFEKFHSTWNYPYHIMNLRCMTDFAFKQCIPYEGNEHLLGTTKDVEG